MLEKIIEIIATRTGIPLSALNSETNLFELDVDSYDFISIIMDIEYSLNVKFEDDEIVELRTPNDILEVILKKFAKSV